VDAVGRQAHVPARAVLTEDVAVEDDRQVELVVVVHVNAPGGAVAGDLEAPGRPVLAGLFQAPDVGAVVRPVVVPPVPVAVMLVTRQSRPRAQPEAETQGEADDTGASDASQHSSP